jgi:hypothetical protein
LWLCMYLIFSVLNTGIFAIFTQMYIMSKGKDVIIVCLWISLNVLFYYYYDQRKISISESCNDLCNIVFKGITFHGEKNK